VDTALIFFYLKDHRLILMNAILINRTYFNEY